MILRQTSGQALRQTSGRVRLPDISGPVNDRVWAIEGVPAGDAAVPWRRCWDLLSRAVARFPAAADA